MNAPSILMWIVSIWLFLAFLAAPRAVAQDVQADCRKLRAAISDLTETFPDRYPTAPHYMQRLEQIEVRLTRGDKSAATDLESLRRVALLANPQQLTHISALGIIALAAFLAVRHATALEAKPNLIFILVDDQGYYDLGCYGGTEFCSRRKNVPAPGPRAKCQTHGRYYYHVVERLPDRGPPPQDPRMLADRR